MKIKKINKMLVISLFILIACSMHAYATINMSMDVKSEFFVSDVVFFNYSLSSDVIENIAYIDNVKCLNVPVAILDIKTATLTPGLPLHGDYKYLKITDMIEPQECTAYLIILEPVQQTISKPFTINTNPSFSFNLILDKKVFVKREDINIDYKSELKNPLVEAILIYPDKSVQQISLPYSFEAKQIGTYELNIVASKEGYKTVSLNEQFGVIKEDSNIEYVTFKEGLVVQENKNLFGKVREGDTIDKIIIFLICILMGFVVLVIVFEVIKKIKSREK